MNNKGLKKKGAGGRQYTLLILFFFSETLIRYNTLISPLSKKREDVKSYVQELRGNSIIKPPLSNYPFLKHTVPFFCSFSKRYQQL